MKSLAPVALMLIFILVLGWGMGNYLAKSPIKITALVILLCMLVLAFVKIEIGLLALMALNPLNFLVTNLYRRFLPMISSGIWNDLLLTFLLGALIFKTILTKERFVRAKPNIVIIIYLSYLFSLTLLRPGPGGIRYEILAYRNFVEPVLVYFLVINIIKRKEQIKLYISFLLIGGLILALEAVNEVYIYFPPIIDFFISPEQITYYNIGFRASAGYDSNDLAYYLNFLIMISFGLLVVIPSKRKYFLPLYILLLIFAILLTGSRGGLLALMVGIMTFVFVPNFIPRFTLSARRLILVTSVIVGIFLCFNVLSETAGRTFTRITSVSVDSSYDNRSKLILRYAIEIIPESPLVGFGLSSVGNVKQGSVLSGERLRGTTHRAAYRSITHNDFLRIAVQSGSIGLALYLYIMGTFIKMSFELYRTFNRGYYKGLALGIIAFYVVFIVGSMTQNVSENQILGFFFWFIGGVVVVLHNELKRRNSVRVSHILVHSSSR